MEGEPNGLSYWPWPAEGARPPAQRRTVPRAAGPEGRIARGPGPTEPLVSTPSPCPGHHLHPPGPPASVPTPAPPGAGWGWGGRGWGDSEGRLGWQPGPSPFTLGAATGCVCVCLSRRMPLCVSPWCACMHTRVLPTPCVPTCPHPGACGGWQGRCQGCGLAPPARDTASSSGNRVHRARPRVRTALLSLQRGRWFGPLVSPSLSVLRAGDEQTSPVGYRPLSAESSGGRVPGPQSPRP